MASDDLPKDSSRASRGRVVTVPPPSAGGPPSSRRPPSTPPAPAPPPPAPAPSRVGLIVSLMLLVPLSLLVLALALVPEWRPWNLHSIAPPSATGRVAAAETPSEASEIRGRVVDADGDEVEGAHVTLIGPSPGYARLRDLTTEKEGSFLFSDVRPGTVQVIAEHDSGIVASAELQAKPGSSIVDLVLALGPARVVRGIVSDEENKPISGAIVTIDEPGWARRTATTTDDGSFRLARVASEARLVRVTAAHFGPGLARLAEGARGPEEIVNIRLRKEADVDGIVFDETGAALRATVLACDGKDAQHRTVSGADGRFHFPRDLASCAMIAVHDKYAPSDPVIPGGDTVTLRMKPGGGISGNVVDDGGSPVTAFFLGVETFTPSYGDREFSVRTGGTSNFTDPNGAFILEKLAPGSYVLSVGTEGRVAVRSASIEVTAGKVTRDVRIVLARGGAVEGQVFDDEKRSPIVGARVSFDATTSTRGDGAVATTDAAGRYRLESAPIGPFSLRVEADGFRTRLLSALKVDAKQVLKQDIGLKVAEDGGAKLEFAGVGALLGQTREGIAFTGVFDGSPAVKAGVQQGDLLRKIDGQSAEGMSVADAIQRLRGEENSVVRVTVERGGQSFDLAIVRAAIVR